MYYDGSLSANNNNSKINIGKILLRILLILTAISLILAFTVFHSSGHTTEKYIELKVEDGQTLWAIASKNNPGNKDIRKLVYDIKKLNKLDTVKLHPGDKIKIPVK